MQAVQPPRRVNVNNAQRAEVKEKPTEVSGKRVRAECGCEGAQEPAHLVGGGEAPKKDWA